MSDAAKYLKTILPEMEESNPAMYKVNQEKLRFIKLMLRGLKTADSVAEVAERVLPKHELHVLQPAVRFIDTSFANTTRNRYIRNEVMFLISY